MPAPRTVWWALLLLLSGQGLLHGQPATVGHGFMQMASFQYLERIAENVPLGSNEDGHAPAIDVGDRSKPTLADLDHDGDLDLLVGGANGWLTYYENIGTPTEGVFKFSSLLSGLDIGNEAAPALGDLDGDGDLDLLIGCDDYRLFFYENTGTITKASFALRTGDADPFSGYQGDASYWGNYTCPTITDVNGSGRMDVVVGDVHGEMQYFQNDSHDGQLVFTWMGGLANRFKDVSVGSHLAPCAVDNNGNGRPEGLLFGTFANDYPHLCWAPGGAFYFQEPLPSGQFLYPVYSLEEGERSCAPAVGDLDGDGEMDLILGGTTGRLFLFRGGAGAGYEVWQALCFNLPGEANLAEPAADPDGDRIRNLVEYALGLLPKSADASPFPLPLLDNGGHLTQALQIRDDDPKLSVVAEVSADLSFASVTTIQPVISDPDPDDGLKTLTFTDPTPAATAPRHFLRFRFDHAP